MAKNEIRIRKKIISPDNIDQHKNYSSIIKKHEKYLKLQGLLRFIIFFTIAVIFMVIVLFVLWRVKEEQYKKMIKEKPSTSEVRGTNDPPSETSAGQAKYEL
jgi:hypothetical protein